MLVFLLSFYLYYDLISCDEVVLAKFNESLLHKHSQKLLEVHDLLKDLEQQTKELSILIKEEFENDKRKEEFNHKNITNDLRSELTEKEQKNTENLTNAPAIEVFRPSPEYDPFDPHLGLSTMIPGSEAPPVIPQHSLDPIDLRWDLGEPPHPRFLLRPMYSMYHGVMPPRFLGHIFPNSPNSTGPTSNRLHVFPHAPNFYLYKKPQFLNAFLHKHRHELNPFRPEFVPPFDDPNFHNPHFSRPPLSSFKTSSPESTLSSTKKTKKTKTIDRHAKIWLQEIAPYTRRKRRKKKTTKDQAGPHQKRPTVPMSPRLTEPTNYWFFTETASTHTEQLFNTDKHGYLQETVTETVVRPMQIPEDPQENWMTTTARDVLHETIKEQSSTTLSPDQRYQELMKQLGEGYLMVFIIELFRLIAVKDKREVREVLAPVESIIVRWLASNQLFWIDDPLLAVIEKLTVLTSKADNIDALRSYSSAMFHTLLQRKQQLTSEVNSIVDVAESFYGDAEGRRLLYSLRQFEEYPNTTKPGNQICEGLIESFLQPLRPPAVTVTRGRLLYSVNRVLRQKYPQLLRKDRGGTAAVEGPPMTATQTSEIKKNHHHKKRKRRRHLKPEYYNIQMGQDRLMN